MGTTFTAIDPNLKWYLTLIVLTAALVAGTVWASRVWNDLKGEAEEDRTDPDELISPLAQAFAAGQMSDEEYQRIKESSARLAGSPVDDPSPPPRPKIVPTQEAPPDDPA